MKSNNQNTLESRLIKEIDFVEDKLCLPKNLLSFVSDGKRIRAKIIASPALASIVELTHASSLIHDDIIDESKLRRGTPTAFSMIPIANASSIGYLIFSRLFLGIIRLKPFVYKNYFRILSEMCIGQIMEIQSMHQNNGSIQRYLQTIRYKTGSLFAFCFGLKDNRWSSNDASLGYKFGSAFQILDDLYDVTLDEKTSGKPTRQDAKQGINTLPFLYGDICSAKNKALDFFKNIDFKKLPIVWQDQFSELVNRINEVSCNTSPENKDSNKDSPIFDQTGE